MTQIYIFISCTNINFPIHESELKKVERKVKVFECTFYKIIIMKCNYHHNYWKKYFFVIENRFLCRLLLPLCFHPLLKLEEKYAATINASSSIYKISTEWGEQKPLLKISDRDSAIGFETLGKMGLSKEDWFVCIHAREGGYSQSDEHLHSFRNTPIEDFLPAIKFNFSKSFEGDNFLPLMVIGSPFTNPIVTKEDFFGAFSGEVVL